jgi:hypothetical protein
VPLEEKKSAPSRSEVAAVDIGDGRASLLDIGLMGLANMVSYSSRRFSKDVGKKMSKYPGWTASVEHGTIIFFSRVCTTGALYPSIVSGKDEKSVNNSRWRGKFCASSSSSDINFVGMYSGCVRFGAKGRSRRS